MFTPRIAFPVFRVSIEVIVEVVVVQHFRKVTTAGKILNTFFFVHL